MMMMKLAYYLNVLLVGDRGVGGKRFFSLVKIRTGKHTHTLFEEEGELVLPS
jgi:hypothetical protein